MSLINEALTLWNRRAGNAPAPTKKVSEKYQIKYQNDPYYADYEYVENVSLDTNPHRWAVQGPWPNLKMPTSLIALS